MSLIPEHVKQRMNTLRARGHSLWCCRVWTLGKLGMPDRDFVGLAVSAPGDFEIAECHTHASARARLDEIAARFGGWKTIGQDVPPDGPIVVLTVFEAREVFTDWVHIRRPSPQQGTEA